MPSPGTTRTFRGAVGFGWTGVPVTNAQRPAPAAFTARTRTRYSVRFVRPVIACVAVVPVWLASTQPVAAFEPGVASLSAEAEAV